MREREKKRTRRAVGAEREKRIATRWGKRDRRIPNRAKEGREWDARECFQVRERDGDSGWALWRGSEAQSG